MILNVRHRTRYEYANDAAFSQHLLRLTPHAPPGQRVLDSALKIEPEPESIDTHRDVFGNRVHVATVSRPHGTLDIISTARIDRRERGGLILDASQSWEQCRDVALGTNGTAPPADVAAFAFPSHMTGATAAIEAYGRESFMPDRPILAAAKDLTHRIYTDFTYQPGATSADTTPTQSFARKKGVCQDFAHIMLACLRALRVPARYISGYLRTIPPEGKERLQGADASHAWVSIWEPTFGWIDFDPTNDCLPGEDHVSLAHGRDYGDVSPVSGVVVGAGAQTLTVEVDVLQA